MSYQAKPNKRKQKAGGGKPAIRAGLSVQELKAMTAMRIGHTEQQENRMLSPSDLAGTYDTATPDQLRAAGIVPVVFNDKKHRHRGNNGHAKKNGVGKAEAPSNHHNAAAGAHVPPFYHAGSERQEVTRTSPPLHFHPQQQQQQQKLMERRISPEFIHEAHHLSTYEEHNMRARLTGAQSVPVGREFPLYSQIDPYRPSSVQVTSTRADYQQQHFDYQYPQTTDHRKTSKVGFMDQNYYGGAYKDLSHGLYEQGDSRAGTTDSDEGSLTDRKNSINFTLPDFLADIDRLRPNSLDTLEEDPTTRSSPDAPLDDIDVHNKKPSPLQGVWGSSYLDGHAENLGGLFQPLTIRDPNDCSLESKGIAARENFTAPIPLSGKVVGGESLKLAIESNSPAGSPQIGRKLSRAHSGGGTPGSAYTPGMRMFLESDRLADEMASAVLDTPTSTPATLLRKGFTFKEIAGSGSNTPHSTASRSRNNSNFSPDVTVATQNRKTLGPAIAPAQNDSLQGIALVKNTM